MHVNTAGDVDLKGCWTKAFLSDLLQPSLPEFSLLQEILCN